MADIDQSVSCTDLDNIAGVVDEIIYGYYEDVASWPDYPAPAAADGTMSFEEAGEELTESWASPGWGLCVRKIEDPT